MNTPPDLSAPPAQKAGTPAIAIWALVLGLLSFVASILTGIPAVICGHITLAKINKGELHAGKGMAIAALVLGYFSLAVLPILCGMLYTGASAALSSAEKARTHNSAYNLKNALGAYHVEYRRVYPGIDQGKPFTETNTAFMAGVLAAESDSGNQANPRGILFFSARPATKSADGTWTNGIEQTGDSSGNLWDAWGNLFRVKHESQKIKVWSPGPDGIDGTADDVKTW